MPTTERVRDPIHQFITLDKDEWEAVNSPVFQRLRRIGQLAMTHLVYPGATHTRFEHSIGVRHVAWLLCEQLDLDDGQRRPVLHAALLHDIGHGPFSHVSEQVLDEVSGTENVHEAISVALIRADPTLRGALGEDNCDAAAQLLEGGRQSVEQDIVNGSTDADKLDYLFRDTYFAGAEYGRYDLPRLIESARIVGRREAQTYLGFDIGGLWAVEGLLLARHHMWRQVYGHKTRLATDIMVTRALLAGIEVGVIPAAAFTVPIEDGKPKPTVEFLNAFLEQDDPAVMECLREAPEGTPARAELPPLRDAAPSTPSRRQPVGPFGFATGKEPARRTVSERRQNRAGLAGGVRYQFATSAEGLLRPLLPRESPVTVATCDHDSRRPFDVRPRGIWSSSTSAPNAFRPPSHNPRTPESDGRRRLRRDAVLRLVRHQQTAWQGNAGDRLVALDSKLPSTRVDRRRSPRVQEPPSCRLAADERLSGGTLWNRIECLPEPVGRGTSHMPGTRDHV